jgi:predicted amino acid dehydrogenase
MLSESSERVEEIRREARTAARYIEHVHFYAEGAGAKLWITGKAESGAGVNITRFAPVGAVVLNFSVPDPLTPELLQTRSDIIHLDGGLMQYDPKQVRINFTMRLKPGLTYACHAGTMVHGLEGWAHHEVGAVDMQQIWQVWQCAEKHGFSLPPWTNHLAPVKVTPALQILDPRPLVATTS